MQGISEDLTLRENLIGPYIRLSGDVASGMMSNLTSSFVSMAGQVKSGDPNHLLGLFNRDRKLFNYGDMI